MKILVNCSNLRFGGAKTVGMNIIRYFLDHTGHRLVIIAPTDKEYQQFETERSEVVTIPEKYNSPLRKTKLNKAVLPGLEQRFKPDVVLSLGNIAFRAQAPQLLLIHQAFLVYPRSEVWKRIGYRQWLYLKSMVFMIGRSLKHATYIRLQTQTMYNRFRNLFPQYKEIGILPNSIATTSLRRVKPLDLSTDLETVRFLFLSKYYPHKNFEILLEVAEMIRAQKLKYTFTLTIDEADNKESAAFLRKIKDRGLENILINKGHVSFEQIPEAYEEHTALFLPTLLESFSGTYIEAMHFGRLIFTSDMDFAREVCQDYAFYFDPGNAKNIISVLNGAFADRQQLSDKLALGQAILQSVRSWKDIGDELDQFLEQVVSKQKKDS